MNFVMTSEEVFKQYGVTITTERKLKDGRYLAHFEAHNPMFVLARFDERVEMMTEDALRGWLEFVEGE